MDNNIPEKKPKRPRIGQTPAASADNGGSFDRSAYGERNTGADGSAPVQGGARPYQPRQYQPRPYQPRHNAEGGDGQERPNRYGQGAPQYRPRPYQPRYNAADGMEGSADAGRDGDNNNRPYQPRRYNNNNYGNNNNNYGGNNNYGPRRNNNNNNYSQRRPNNNGGNSYSNNRQGGYGNNVPRQGAYSNNRQGGYGNNGPRQGGYGNNRPQNFKNRNKHRNNNFPGKGKMFVPRPKPVEYEMPIPDPNEQIRLNKFMANAGLCSRRTADEYIQQGLVKVNGQVVTELGTKITHYDVVEYDDKVIALERKCYILLNKPKDCVTTSDDPNGRLTVMDLVKGACNERIYPVGRLDRNTTGVLLLTNDGDLASKLTHPQYVKKKIYHVWTDKDISEDDMQRIADGIELEDGEIHADAISYATETDRNQAGIEIHSGRNRIVRRIFESLGYHVTKLDRVYFAGLTKKNLPRGRWRYLTQQEVNYLKMGSFE